VFVGYQAGFSSSTALYTTAVGVDSGRSITTNMGTFVGANAGRNTTGNQNTFVGSRSGYGAGYYVTTGSNNTIIGGYDGNQGGLDIRTSSNNIVLSDGDGNPRVWIDGSGNFNIDRISSDAKFAVSNTSASQTLADLDAANSSFASHVLRIRCDRTSTPDNYNLIQGKAGTSEKFLVRGSGNVLNANNSYGAISDAKLKENIVDANSQWSDIKNLRVRNYNMIEGQTHTQLGVIAQEVETVSAGLVHEAPDYDTDGNHLGTVTKSVNYSVLYMKAVKALQEAMDRIETLEAKVTALENA
jgi:hypothetical protein